MQLMQYIDTEIYHVIPGSLQLSLFVKFLCESSLRNALTHHHRHFYEENKQKFDLNL